MVVTWIYEHAINEVLGPMCLLGLVAALVAGYGILRDVYEIVMGGVILGSVFAAWLIVAFLFLLLFGRWIDA